MPLADRPQTDPDIARASAYTNRKGETLDDVLHSVCDPELPDAGEVWDGVVAKSGEWIDQARADM
jgi:hypothetical protein